ncbi:hypothetical protein BKK49_01365 [Rodentibacter rarus]|uniref:hypothetical protein n=1 Tax=Rodentibacter rarus TaxID=1908260 RepID=UPI0009852179|nr:hypothetical protein [Rodentibacter rarus]OOF43002.1 hypothetical protein BKK49_01365 [Rodentibacter rarus]
MFLSTHKLVVIFTALLLMGRGENLNYRELCVDGVVYLQSYNGSLTPKINADFYPYTCTKGVTDDDKNETHNTERS